MTSNKNINLRSMYSDVHPDPWAVTRMRARLRSEGRATFEDVAGQVFKRYMLALSIVLLILTFILDSRMDLIEDTLPDEFVTWMYGDLGADALVADIPEYTFLTEIRETP